jgi:DNA-directed RNA polymerase specialized sigma24 family protein
VKTDVQEEEIKTGLRGDEQKQFEAICKARDRYADGLAAYVHERIAPTLDERELAAVIDEVFIGLAKKAKNGNFKSDGSLVALLFRMARFRALDKLSEIFDYQQKNVTDQFSNPEKDGATQEDLSNDEVVSIVASKLSDAPEIAAAWRVVTQEWTPGKQVAAAEIIRLFKIWIGSLPRVQRKVAESIARHYGDVTDEEICDEIGKDGQRPPLGSVKSARREIREKFASYIKQKESSN